MVSSIFVFYTFGSVGLAAFWIFSLWFYMDFILFSFLSTQGTFDGDGHLFFVFAISLPFLVALHRRFWWKRATLNIPLYLWLLLASNL